MIPTDAQTAAVAVFLPLRRLQLAAGSISKLSLLQFGLVVNTAVRLYIFNRLKNLAALIFRLIFIHPLTGITFHADAVERMPWKHKEDLMWIDDVKQLTKIIDNEMCCGWAGTERHHWLLCETFSFF